MMYKRLIDVYCDGAQCTTEILMTRQTNDDFHILESNFMSFVFLCSINMTLCQTLFDSYIKSGRLFFDLVSCLYFIFT